MKFIFDRKYDGHNILAVLLAILQVYGMLQGYSFLAFLAFSANMVNLTYRHKLKINKTRELYDYLKSRNVWGKKIEK